MENINLSEDFDDLSEEYWEDSSLFVVRTGIKKEDGENNGKTTSLLAMMGNKDNDNDYDGEYEDLSSGLSSMSSCLVNDSISECNISLPRSSPQPTIQNNQDSESKRNIKAAAEKLNCVTRKMFSSPIKTSLTLHQLSEQFYHAYREFVFSIEEGANKKADITNLGNIIEELKAITETSSHLLLVVNAASVNPSGKEKISTAARAVMDCVDQVIAACSWESGNSNVECKCGYDTGTSESLDAGISEIEMEEKEKECDEDGSPTDSLSSPKIYVKTNHEIIRDGETVDESYQVCTENTTFTTDTLTKDTTIIKDQKLTTGDLVTIKQDVISEHEIVTRKPPISPRKSIKDIQQKTEAKNFRFADGVISLENKEDDKDGCYTSRHELKADLLDREVNILQEIFVDRELPDVPEKPKMVPWSDLTRRKSSRFNPREDINLSPISEEEKDMSKNRVVTSMKTVTTYDSDSLSSSSDILEDLNNYLKDCENIRPTKTTGDRKPSAVRISPSDVVVSKKARFLANKGAMRERSMSTDRIVRAQKGAVRDEIPYSWSLAQKGSSTDKILAENRRINTKAYSSTDRENSVKQMDLIKGETPERRASLINRRSLSETMLVPDEGRNRESKDVSIKKTFNEELKTVKNSASIADKRLKIEKLFDEERGSTTDSDIFDDRVISPEKLTSDRRTTQEHRLKPRVLFNKQKSTASEKGILTDEKRLSHKGLTTEMCSTVDVLVFQEKGIPMERLATLEKTNISDTETDTISNSTISKENMDVYEKKMPTESPVKQPKYFEDKKMAIDQVDSTEKSIEERIHTELFATTQKITISIAKDVAFAEQKRTTEDKAVTADMAAMKQELVTVESGTITDPCEIIENLSASTYCDLSVPKRSTSERGITTDPWPQVPNCETEEKGVVTEPEVTGERLITKEVIDLTENDLASEKSICMEIEVEIPKNYEATFWRVSDVDDSTDDSTFRSLSEHYSKESDESSGTPTEVINLTDEDSGHNFELNFCHPHCSRHTKTVSIYDVYQEESVDSADDDRNGLSMSILLKQFANKERNNCFNICTAIKGGEEKRDESLKQVESEPEPEPEKEKQKTITLYHPAALVSTASQTEISSPGEISTEDITKDSDDDDRLPRMTPSENDYALCRALAELKWAQTSINRLESEKKLLHTQLNEVMQNGFQKGKEQLQQLMQAESMLQQFRQQHEREFQTLTHKKKELIETVNKLQTEKYELLEKLAESEKYCEITKNKIKEIIDNHKNAGRAFDIGKKELNNQVAKLKQQFKNEVLEKQKSKEAVKTLKTELAKLNEDLEKAKTIQRKQAEQLQEAKESSNRLLQRTNSDLFSMQKIQKTLRDNILRLEKEKTTLEYELKCETNKVTILQKDVDALWKECNIRRPCFDKNQIFPQEKSQKEVLRARTQTHNLSQTTEPLPEWEIPSRLPKVSQSQLHVKVPRVPRCNLPFKQSIPTVAEQPSKLVSSLVNETEGSPQQQQQLWQVLLQMPLQQRQQAQSYFEIPSRPSKNAGTESDQSQKATKLQPQNGSVQKDDQCLRAIINEQKIIKSKYEKEQERNRRLQRKILHLKAAEYKKKHFLISKYERERKRLRLIMEKQKHKSKDVIQRLNSADVMLDIEIEKNNVLQREITAINTKKEKQEVKFVNSSQEFEELNTRLTQVELGQTIEKVNSYLEQQQLEYQLRMAERENEIAQEKNKLKEDLLQLRLSYEKILSSKDLPANELCPSKEIYKPSVCHQPFTSSEAKFY